VARLARYHVLACRTAASRSSKYCLRSTRLIATDKVKWSDSYQSQVGVRTEEASLGEAQARKVRDLARKVYRLLGLSGYARIDFRMGADGQAHFLEANPNPQLAYGEDFAESAEKAGISYESLLQRILNLALARRWE